MKELEVKDAMGDTYLVRQASTGTPGKPLVNVFGPVQFMQFDRATFNAFCEAGRKLFDAQDVEIAIAIPVSDAVPA